MTLVASSRIETYEKPTEGAQGADRVAVAAGAHAEAGLAPVQGAGAILAGLMAMTVSGEKMKKDVEDKRKIGRSTMTDHVVKIVQ